MNEEKKNQVVPFDLEAVRAAKRAEEQRNLDAGLITQPAATCDLLQEMNERFALIEDLGGKSQIMYSRYDPTTKQQIIRYIPPTDFKVNLCHRSVPTGRNSTPLGVWWLTHPNRRTYSTVFFDPSAPPEEQGCYNTWRGITTEEKKGCWKRTIAHIYRILCDRNPESFRYVMRWFAWTVQNPGHPAEVVIIFRGKEGAGKGFIFTQMCELLKGYSHRISNREHLTGKFNEHLSHCVFLFADEAYHPGDKEAEGVLKNLITESTIAIEAKFRGVYNQRNCLHIGMATNQNWVIPVNVDSRRYFITTVNNCYAKGSIADDKRELYFDKLWGEVNNGGREAMLYDLKHMKLGDWHPRKGVPHTEELSHQVFLNQPKVVKALKAWFDEGVFPGKQLKGEYRATLGAIKNRLEQFEPDVGKASQQKLAEALKTVGATRLKTGGQVVWVMSSLPIMKKNWEEKYGKTTWECAEEDWTDTSY